MVLFIENFSNIYKIVWYFFSHSSNHSKLACLCCVCCSFLFVCVWTLEKLCNIIQSYRSFREISIRAFWYCWVNCPFKALAYSSKFLVCLLYCILILGKTFLISLKMSILPTNESFLCYVVLLFYLFLCTSWKGLEERLSHLTCHPDVLF